ncbi:MAG: hypothetical protein WD738_18580 [Pirellulales bacterium]
MQLVDFCPTGSRIVEINPVDGALGAKLIAAGYTHYLAVTANERRRDAIVEKLPALAHCLTISRSSQVVRQNNAEVLILNGWSSLHIAWFRSVRHASNVALTLKPSPLCWLAVQLGFILCLLGRFAWPRIVSCDTAGRSPRLIAFRVRRPRPHKGARRFIPHVLGVEGFFRRMRTSGGRHAVLRWYESLPSVAPGEDIDLLVDDVDLERVRASLDEGPGVQPIDLYSVTGLPGSDYCKMTYFPPYVAEELLERAVDYRGICRVPAAREHFLSMAYHALYHKGFRSGLVRRGESQPRYSRPDHDYATVLRDLAERLNIDVPITLEDLDEFLDSQGWRPPYDMLVRLSRGNDWLWSLVKRELTARGTDDGLAVFLIREEAMRRGGVERAARWLSEQGFQILATNHFDAKVSKRVARNVRGGNWGPGPWSFPGGGPAAAIVVYDPAPIRPWNRRKRRLPYVANTRLYCKRRLRDYFNEGYPKDQHCNVVHSSDNGRETMEYLRIIMPDEIDDVLSRAPSLKMARAA